MSVTPRQIDALTEIINIGVGQAASILNEMLESHVSLRVPRVIVLRRSDLPDHIGNYSSEMFSSVKMSFQGALSGVASLVFPPDSASKLVSIVTGEEMDSPDLDSLRVETLNEVGNIVLNGVMGTVGNTLEKDLQFSIPNYYESTIKGLVDEEYDFEGSYALAEAVFTLEEHRIRGDILLLFEVTAFDSILKAIDEIEMQS